MNQRFKTIAIACLLFSSMSFADIGIQTSNPDIKLSLDGKGWVESGQYVDYFNLSTEYYHSWISRTFLDLKLNAVIKERLSVSLGMEGKMWFNVPKQTGTSQSNYRHRSNSDFIISDANAAYSFGNIESPYLSLQLGLFPYKYDKDARNLGEYIFRTGTYPAYIINNFDLAFARLTGLKISSDLFGCLHQDLIYSIETTIPPFFDGTLTYLADYNFKKIIDVGAGVSFANLVSVDEAVTTPKTSLASTKNRYVTSDGDTGYYTFRGTKLMGKLCFDPKSFIPVKIFGSEDLKLYMEAAVLGLESYPKNDSVNALGSSKGYNIYGYDTLKNKVPIMGGINIPTFKLLNVLALECEWYTCPYPNSYLNRLGIGPNQNLPLPDSKRSGVDYTADTWKWSVYAKKTFYNDHLGVILQFARDHIRTETVIDESMDCEEALSLNKQWWWMMKFEAKF